MAEDPNATSWDDLRAEFGFTPEEDAEIERRAAELRQDIGEAYGPALTTDLDDER